MSSLSSSIDDGFRGARDAAILESYGDWKSGMAPPETVSVQRVAKTHDLLKRAGFARTSPGEFYDVPVIVDSFNRLQLAPKN